MTLSNKDLGALAQEATEKAFEKAAKRANLLSDLGETVLEVRKLRSGHGGLRQVLQGLARGLNLP